MKRFRIAFSFAGEKRAFVAEVAVILAARFGETAILYDKFHEAEFARYDLGIRLPILYGEQSDLIVPVLCPRYDEKRWTGWEWVHIYGLLTKAEGHRVMPCRFELANVEGLSKAAAFIELDDKTPEQAATLILERLALNEGKHKDHYTKPVSAGSKPPSTSTPNNLPRLQPFFGRAAELATIREALDPDSRTWGALIDGPGGMGKTSLAVRAAYDTPPGLFQRIVFVSVKDREMDDDGERPLGNLLMPGFLEMLNELARELGQPDIAKSPEDQRIRLLLDALRPAQALLILDNLESLPKTDRDQLFTFVKRLPPGCKAILTSRRRIGSGSEELILEKLDQDAALATLADLARRNPLLARTSEAERIALYTQTAGKPLLLRWVAGQLGRGSCRNFTDALAFLRTCPPDNDPLEFIFGDLAKEFAADEEKVLCALTYFSLPAKVKHLAEIAAFDEAPVKTALNTLANRSLVVPDQEEKHYALVPMVAEFLRKHRPEVVADTGRWLEKCAFVLVVENGFDKHDRFSVLDDAWPTISAALPCFLAGANDPLQTICGALKTFLNFTGRWDERLGASMKAESKAVAAKDFLNAGWRVYEAGWIHYLRRQADAVVACGDRAAAHFNIAQAGARERAMAKHLFGLGYKLKKDYSSAIAAYNVVLDLLRTLSAESPDVVTALNALAEVKRLSGDFAAAERDYREAFRIASALGYTEGMASCIGNLAMMGLECEDWPMAEALGREALSLSEKVGRQELIATSAHNLARALVRQGKTVEALPYARSALDIYTRLGSPDLEDARATLQECESDTNFPDSSGLDS